MPQLTPREAAVADLMCLSLPEKEIARILGVKLRTVKMHKHHIYLRYGIFEGHKRVKLVVQRTKEQQCRL